MMRMLPLARLGQDLAFQFDAGGADFLEARRNDDGGLHAFLGAIVDDAGHGGGRRHDHGQIHRLGYLRDMLVGLDAQHAGPLRIDGEDGAAERAADQVPENGASHGAGGFGGADDRHGFGSEEYIERLRAFFDGFTRWFDDLRSQFIYGLSVSAVDPKAARLRAASTSWLKAVLACHGLDIAVVATGAETQLLEDRYGFRMRLFDVADDHVVADELIESKHGRVAGAPLKSDCSRRIGPKYQKVGKRCLGQRG